MVTGTPMVNSAEDMWILLDVMGIRTDLNDFTRQFCKRVHNGRAWTNTGIQNKGALAKLIGDRWIRRTKTAVLKDLPEKQSHIMDVRMEEDQRQVYDRLVEAMFLEIALSFGHIMEVFFFNSEIIRISEFFFLFFFAGFDAIQRI